MMLSISESCKVLASLFRDETFVLVDVDVSRVRSKVELWRRRVNHLHDERSHREMRFLLA